MYVVHARLLIRSGMMDPSPSSFLLLPPTTPTTQEVKMEKVSIATSPPSYACASHPWLLASQLARLLAAGWLARQRLREWRGESACLRATSWLPAWVLAESSKIHAYLSFCRPWRHSIWCDCCITSFYLGFKKWEILWISTKKLRKRKIKSLANTMLNSPANTGRI